MAHYLRIKDFACLVALLVTVASALPMSTKLGQVSENVDDLHIAARSIGDSDESQEILRAKKIILERMLKETDDKLSNYDDGAVSKKSIGHEIVSRFTDHGPAARRPSKKSSVAPYPRSDNSELSDNQPPLDDIEKLSRLLALLEKGSQDKVETTTTATTSSLPLSPSLFQKLADLDIDLFKLLHQAGGYDAEKRTDPNDYRNGRYPKAFITK